jgi:uncharacterized membrane protein
VAVLSAASGYIRFIDTRRLTVLAKHYHVSIRVLRRVGHFVPAEIPLMMVSKGNRLPPEGTAELLAAFDLGPPERCSRTWNLVSCRLSISR